MGTWRRRWQRCGRPRPEGVRWRLSPPCSPTVNAFWLAVVMPISRPADAGSSPVASSNRGEAPQAALEREIAEELGVEIEVGDLLDSTTSIVDGVAINLSCYFVRAVGDAPQFSTDHDELAWCQLRSPDVARLGRARPARRPQARLLRPTADRCRSIDACREELREERRSVEGPRTSATLEAWLSSDAQRSNPTPTRPSPGWSDAVRGSSRPVAGTEGEVVGLIDRLVYRSGGEWQPAVVARGRARQLGSAARRLRWTDVARKRVRAGADRDRVAARPVQRAGHRQHRLPEGGGAVAEGNCGDQRPARPGRRVRSADLADLARQGCQLRQSWPAIRSWLPSWRGSAPNTTLAEFLVTYRLAPSAIPCSSIGRASDC